MNDKQDVSYDFLILLTSTEVFKCVINVILINFGLLFLKWVSLDEILVGQYQACITVMRKQCKQKNSLSHEISYRKRKV